VLRARRAGLIVLLLVLPACRVEHDRFTVITFNACGNVCGAGGDAAPRFVLSLVERTAADVVLLQEVCRSQAAALRPRLHVHYVSTFRGDADGRNRCPGGDYGIAVATRSSIERRFRLPLPNPGLGETQIDERAIACVDAAGVTACSTHLVRSVNDAAAHDAQVRAVVDQARTLRPPVVIGGDLNAPASAFAELDRRFVSGPWDERSIDRVFATSSRFELASERTYRCRCSDHAARVIRLAPSGTLT